MSLRRPVVGLILSGAIIAGVVLFGVSLARQTGLARSGRAQIAIAERTLRDIHCALLGYQGPRVVRLQLKDINLVPARDCGPPLGKNIAIAAANRNLLMRVLAGIQVLLDRPTRVVVTEGGVRTIIVTRTRTVTVTRCVRPNGRPC